MPLVFDGLQRHHGNLAVAGVVPLLIRITGFLGLLPDLAPMVVRTTTVLTTSAPSRASVAS